MICRKRWELTVCAFVDGALAPIDGSAARCRRSQLSQRNQMNVQERGASPLKRSSERAGRMSGDLIVFAALIGISRALFAPQKERPVQRTVSILRDPHPGIGDRGRSAQKPTDIPARGWTDIAWRLYEAVGDDRVLLVSAGVTFYALLALFPACAAIVALYGLFADVNTINEHLQRLSGFLPEGALQVIGDQVKRIAAQGQATLSATFFGTLAFSLWGANAGTKAIFDALNIAYKEHEERGFVRLTLTSLMFTLCAVVLVIVAMAGIVAVPVVLKLMGASAKSFAGLLSLLRWPLLYLIILLALACLYRYGPSRNKPQWRWVTWGSAIASGIWIVGSLLLSWYVSNFGTYNATYGSLGAVIGFMVWMWLSTVTILLGAEINAEMEHQTARDTTVGGGKPIGARRATMADEVGPARA